MWDKEVSVNEIRNRLRFLPNPDKYCRTTNSRVVGKPEGIPYKLALMGR